MSIKDLEPLQPTSPFYPEFIPNGSEVSTLFTKVQTYSLDVLPASTPLTQISAVQPMGLPVGAQVSFFICQMLDQNIITVLSGSPAINISDVSYSSVTDDMSFDINFQNLVADTRPSIICTVFYFF